jgi:hypothetical protein
VYSASPFVGASLRLIKCIRSSSRGKVKRRLVRAGPTRRHCSSPRGARKSFVSAVVWRRRSDIPQGPGNCEFVAPGAAAQSAFRADDAAPAN